MIRNLSQVILRVNDVEASAKFWQDQLGFVVVNRITLTETNEEVIEVGAHLNAETTIVLQAKNVTAEDVSPMLVFNTTRFDDFHVELSDKITVGKIETIHGVRTFTFEDLDNHVFRVKEAAELQFD